MHPIKYIFITLFVIQGCQTQGIPTSIIVSKTVMHQRPDPLSPEVTTLTYGQQVKAYSKKSNRSGDNWTEIRLDKKHSGFVKSYTLGTPELMESFQKLKKSIEGIEPQAAGIITAPTFFRLEPGRQGTPVEKLPTGTRFEMFERQATRKSNSTTGRFSPKSTEKDIWYKVRLSDGRVGYIFKSNFNLEPPAEISYYTRSRRALAWQKLRTVTGKDGESISDYLVAYATPGADFSADFNRIEVYYWDGGQYQTSFVLSSLRGILPIRVIHEENKIYFEFAEIDPNHEKQVIVSRYPNAYPYKAINRSHLAKDVGLH